MTEGEAVPEPAVKAMATEPPPYVPNSELLTRLTGGLLLALVLTCWPLFTARSLPHVGFFSVPDLAHLCLAAVLALLSTLLMVGGGPKRLRWVTAAVLTLCLVTDELRGQPWAFEIGAFLILLAACTAEKARAGMQIYLVGLYVWAGLHKAQGEFIDRVVPWFFEPFDLELSESTALVVGSGIILAEAGAGLALLVKRLRRVAVCILLATHLGVLVVLGPWGHDWDLNVWPWNVGQAVLVSVLFWSDRQSGLRLLNRAPRSLTFFAVCLPVLHLGAWWPANLSHALYAGNYAQPGFLVRHDSAASVMRGGQRNYFAPGLPPPIREVLQGVEPRDAKTDWGLMRVHDWAVTDLGATIPPDARIARRLFYAFCQRSKGPDELLLVMRPKRVPWVAEDMVRIENCNGEEVGRQPLPASWPR